MYIDGKIVADVADLFLAQFLSTSRLVCWRDEFYQYKNGFFNRFSTNSLKNSIVMWMRNLHDYREKAKKNFVGEIAEQLRALVSIDSDKDAPFWLDELSHGNCFAMRNGIYNIEKGCLESLNDNYFSLVSLPYDYDGKTTCPIFDKFIQEALPDYDTRCVLQEWFGNNLQSLKQFDKMLIMEGDGANGKSVVGVLLREMLGEKNISALDIEAFSAIRTFPLASTVGKFANISEEMGDVDKACEGTLKKVVSGGVITVERKNKDPFEYRPSMKLTFITNILPRFKDKSNGLWRRIILIPFRNQILDESKQDKRLVSASYWREIGELPGILNWAIEGLKRLLEKGAFTKSEICSNAWSEFKFGSNPAVGILAELVTEAHGSVISANNLYTLYREKAENHGYRPLAHNHFSKEVKRLYSKVELSDNAQYINGHRSRVFTGLRFNEGVGLNVSR